MIGNINKELLPFKIHYFFKVGGLAFLPTYSAISRHKGISQKAIGIIWTVTPIASAAFNITCGIVADKLKIHRLLLLLITLIAGIFLTSLFYLPDIPIPSIQTKNIPYKGQCYTKNTTAILCQSDGVSNHSFDKDYKKFTWNHKEYVNDTETECLYECVSSPHLNTMINQSSALQEYEIIKGNSNLMLNRQDNFIEKCSISDNDALYSSLRLNQCDTPVDLVCDRYCKENNSNQEIDLEYLFSRGEFWMIFVVIVIVFCSLHASGTLVDTMCSVALGENRHKFGQQKLFGSLGIGLMGLVGGILVSYYSEGQLTPNYTPAVIMTVSLNIVAVLVTIWIKVDVPGREPGSSAVGKVVRSFNFIFLMVTVAAVGVTYGVILTFQFIYIEDVAFQWDPDFDKLKILQGLVLFTDCFVGEIPFLFYSAKIIKKLGYVNTFSLTLAATSLRVLLYSCIRNPWIFLLVHLLHGLSFGVFVANMITYASLLAPKGAQATLQSATVTSFTLGRSLGAFTGGLTYESIGGSKTFLILGIFITTYTIIYTIIGFLLSNKKSVKASQDKELGDYVRANTDENNENMNKRREGEIETYVYESPSKLNSLT